MYCGLSFPNLRKSPRDFYKYITLHVRQCIFGRQFDLPYKFFFFFQRNNRLVYVTFDKKIIGSPTIIPVRGLSKWYFIVEFFYGSWPKENLTQGAETRFGTFRLRSFSR